MAQNTAPIFSLVPKIGFGGTDGNGGSTGPLKTANTALDGTGTVLTVYTAGSNGAFIQKVRFRPAGSNILTVARVFINNGSTQATATNNILFDEFTMPLTTASANGALPLYELFLNIAIGPSNVINVTLGTSVSAGYYVSVVGGDY